MKVLGIETSCDETSAAIIDYNRGRFKILGEVINSQIALHRKTGGVVPEVAAREHVKNIIPVITLAFQKAGLSINDIDRIGVVSGPGLITSLLTGVETAKHLAFLSQKKIFAINHIEAHLAANYLLNKKINYPALGLIVSGGHTEIVLITEAGSYKLIGATRDDAAGECFDKCAKILRLPYPGGPEISRHAEKGTANISFPKPMINAKNFDFSFSGLKTSVLYYVRDHKKYNTDAACASIQQSIVDVLVHKLSLAQNKFNAKTIMLAGGVAANLKLRQAMKKQFQNILIPDLQYCTDNGVMVATATALKTKADNIFKIKADPSWEII
ncbi:MAG: tRNA (adenosine(37)-N6)-threonylcarbamoyltransferase complex transferase subunit TsaD [Patescibacteria group bacterium]